MESRFYPQTSAAWTQTTPAAAAKTLAGTIRGHPCPQGAATHPGGDRGQLADVHLGRDSLALTL